MIRPKRHQDKRPVMGVRRLTGQNHLKCQSRYVAEILPALASAMAVDICVVVQRALHPSAAGTVDVLPGDSDRHCDGRAARIGVGEGRGIPDDTRSSLTPSELKTGMVWPGIAQARSLASRTGRCAREVAFGGLAATPVRLSFRLSLPFVASRERTRCPALCRRAGPAFVEPLFGSGSARNVPYATQSCSRRQTP